MDGHFRQVPYDEGARFVQQVECHVSNLLGVIAAAYRQATDDHVSVTDCFYLFQNGNKRQLNSLDITLSV